MSILHAIAMHLFAFGLQLAGALGHDKARRASLGRRGWHRRLVAAAANRPGPWLHVHCASLGEYEQAAPVISALRKAWPGHAVLLTFFSPSGREACPPDAADHIDYLPIDTPQNAQKFAAAMPFQASCWVKYELWPAHLKALERRGVSTHLFAAHFIAGHHPLSAWSGYYRRALQTMGSIQVQDSSSVGRLASFGLHAIATGDPRYDRVQTTAEPLIPAELQKVTDWIDGRKILIAGSSWPAEEEALAALASNPAWPADWCLLVVPHEVAPEKIAATRKRLASVPPPRLFIVDRIGWLRALYPLSDLAVVGGGWGAGIHNILEPAAHGLPIAFGPRHERFLEAERLVQCGGAFAAPTPQALNTQLQFWMRNPADRQNAATASRQHIDQAAGAAQRIADHIIVSSNRKNPVSTGCL